jgi:hypothetical protein
MALVQAIAAEMEDPNGQEMEDPNGLSCAASCTDDLRSCGDASRSVHRLCRTGCKDIAAGVVDACKNDFQGAEKGECVGAAGAAKGECLGGCAGQRATSQGKCVDDLLLCLESCLAGEAPPVDPPGPPETPEAP